MGTVRLFLQTLAGTAAGMALIGLGNGLLGATWAETQAKIPGYVVSALGAAVALTAYQVWRQRRAGTEESTRV